MNLLRKLLVLVILITIFSSCEKNNPKPDNNIYWTVNGVNKSARPDASAFTDGSFLLQATSGNDYISLFIDSTTHIGTFHLDNPFENALIEYKVGKTEDYYTDNGTLVISDFGGGVVKGTFSFHVGTGSSERQITDGTFYAKLHYYDFSDTTSYTNDSLFNVMKIRHLAIQRKKISR